MSSSVSKSATARVLAAVLMLACVAAPMADNAGSTQSQIMPRAREALLLDVASEGARLVAVGERGHILLSDDQGQRWRQVAAPTRALLTAVFFIDAKQGWAVGHDGVILGTADGGDSWQKLRTEQLHDDTAPALMDVWFADSQRGWAVGAYGVFLSTQDGGMTWDDAADRLSNPDELHLNAITGDAQGTLYIVGEQGGIFVSTDAGKTWTAADSGYEGSLFAVLSSSDGSEIYACGLRGTLLRSADRGTTWFAMDTGTDTNLNGGFINNERLVLVGLEGTIIMRRHDATAFTVIDSGTRSGFSSAVALNHSRLLAAGQGGARVVSLDNNKTRQ